MCLELRLSGGQFHLARPAFPVWFVAIGNKLGEVSPLPPILAAVLAAYFKEEEGKKKTLENLSPLCLDFGEKVSSAHPHQLVGPCAGKAGDDCRPLAQQGRPDSWAGRR